MSARELSSVSVWFNILLLFTASLIMGGVAGCPIFGCYPGGSFSFQLRLPTSPVHVMWESRVPLKPLHKALGCVGNIAAIICPIITNETVGYGCFNVKNGNLTWSDRILLHPPLPLMDIYGDIIGSDGEKLLQYRVDGTVLQPVIDFFPPMGDIFSLDLADNGILLLTSSHGVVTTYFTNGVPGATMTLRYKVKNETGIFRPVTTPVISGHRSYILTVFEAKNKFSKVNGLLRLFAIDLNDQFVGKIKVAWYIDLRPDTNVDTKLQERHVKTQVDEAAAVGGLASDFGSVLVHKDVVFVAIPSVSLNSSTNSSNFWAVRDAGKHGYIKYNDSLNVDDLSLFDISATNKLHVADKSRKFPHAVKRFVPSMKYKNMKYKSFEEERADSNAPNSRTMLWGSVKEAGLIYGFDISGGDIKKVTRIYMSDLFQTKTNITSKVMTVRDQSNTTDSLVFGVHAVNKTRKFSNVLKYYSCVETSSDNYLVALKVLGGLSPLAELLWIIPVPGDGRVEGQILGIPADQSTSQSTDIIVAYSVGQNASSIFAVH